MMSRSENEVRELARVKTLRTVEQADREVSVESQRKQSKMSHSSLSLSLSQARNEAVDILRKAAQAKV